MYKYYLEIESEKHLLFPSEIASALRLYSESGKLHEKYVLALSEFISPHKLYYNTRNGLRRVIEQDVLIQIIEHIEKLKEKFQSNTIVDCVSSKKYKLKIMRE